MHSFKKKYKLTKRKVVQENNLFWLEGNGLWAQLQSGPIYNTIDRDHIEAATDYIYSSPRRVGHTFASTATIEDLHRLLEEEIRRQAYEVIERRRRSLEEIEVNTRDGQLLSQTIRSRSNYLSHLYGTPL